LLPSAKSIVCVGKLYNGPEPYSTRYDDAALGWISRYAWGEDYHGVMKAGLETLAAQMGPDHEWRAFADTAPLLERSYARQAGLGWIGKNTCLIHQGKGSWFFLGELLTSLEIEPDSPPAERCGTCTACIDACPTGAIVPFGDWWTVDARLCISYFTIELRGPIPEEHRAGMGRHVFGCDICQDVCPWNRRAAIGRDPDFAPRPGLVAPPLERLAGLTLQEFEEMFQTTPVPRARYQGFLRNVCVAMGNAGEARFREPLERLAASGDEVVAEHARWALARI
jgi:epoxyqueuosine reductase